MATAIENSQPYDESARLPISFFPRFPEKYGDLPRQPLGAETGRPCVPGDDGQLRGLSHAGPGDSCASA